MARRPSRGLLSMARSKPRRIVQDFNAIDEFGEVAERKRTATETAHKLGHQLGKWHKRKQDTAGRIDTFCVDCNRAIVVCTVAPEGMPDVYGPALKESCVKETV